MYFQDKFNKEIQVLCRHQPTGGSTTLGDFDSEAFFRISPVNPNHWEKPYFVKVIPLIMFNKLESSNPDDVCYDDLCLVCKNVNGTKIRCWTE